MLRISIWQVTLRSFLLKAEDNRIVRIVDDWLHDNKIEAYDLVHYLLGSNFRKVVKPSFEGTDTEALENF